jgi:hypothetical protein
MSYRTGGYKSPFVGVGVVVGGLAVLFFGLRGLALLFNATGLGVPTPQSVEKMLFSNADTGVMYRTLKRTHPDDYDALTADILRHLKAGETYPQIDRLIATDLKASEARNRKYMAQAPDDRIDAFRHAEIGIVEMLRDADPRLCASYVVTGEVKPQSLRAFTKTLVADRIAGLEASAAGRDHPANRVIARPTRTDIQTLSRLMVANGSSEQHVQAYLDGTLQTKLSALEQCLVGLSFYRAIDQMPAGKGDQFYAYLLSRN